jgi:hypothetical protein
VEARTAEQRTGGNSSILPAVSIVAAIGAGAVANFKGGGGDNGGVGPFFVDLAVCLVVAAVLYLRVVPRNAGSTRTAWILALLSVLTLAAFWSGVPLVFGLAAVAVATPEPRTGARTAAIVVAALACLADVAAVILG